MKLAGLGRLWLVVAFVLVPAVLAAVAVLFGSATVCSAAADTADRCSAVSASYPGCPICLLGTVGIAAILSLWYWWLAVPYQVLLIVIFWLGVVTLCRSVL